MSRPAETVHLSPAPALLCAVGLFLTVVEVNGFGFDFANDTVGFTLVCIGAARLSGEPGRAWSLLAAASAGLAAAVSLFTYGGPVGQVVPMTYRWWNTTFYLEATALAGVVIGLLLMIRSAETHTREVSTRPARALPLLAGAYAAAAGLHMVLFATQSAYFGPLGHVRQANVVAVGLLECVTVVAVFIASRGRT